MKKIINKIQTNPWQFFMVVSKIIILNIFFSMLIPDSAHATEFFVNDTTELISAINSANDELENPGPDTISLTFSTYILTNTDNENDGPNGLPSITTAITINGNLSSIERSNDDQTPEFRILHTDSTGILILNDLTISNGQSPEEISGGGLYNRGVLTLSACDVSGNQAGSGGHGGFYGGDGGDGGGIFNHAGDVTIENSTFSSNQAGSGGFGNYGGDGGDGGGILNYAGDVRITNSTFNHNNAGVRGYGTQSDGHGGSGGGLLIREGEGTIENTIFGGNQGRLGGGVYNGGDVALFYSSFFVNNAGYGGGIYNMGIMSIENSIIYGNDVDYCGSGGGIRNRGTMTITNSTISGNSACGSGGGINNSSGAVSIKSSTITGNGAGFTGGGISSSQYDYFVSIQNTIIAKNSAYNYDNCTGRGAVASLGHNLVEKSGECGYNSDIGDIFAANPMLGTLSDNGGATLTHALLQGSPAIDSGDEEDYPPTDQRGSLRPVDGNLDGVSICDIGAYEVQECEGDFEPDGDVDGSDLAVFAADFGRTDCNNDCEGDFEPDGDVDGSDLAVFAADFGRTNCPIFQE